jgi:hypothetical protein
VTYRNPGLLEDILEFLFEDLRVGIDATIHPLARFEGRIGGPLTMVFGSHVGFSIKR